MRLLLHTLPMLLLLLACQGAAAADVPGKSELLPGLSVDSMQRRLAQLPLQPIEGIWEYKADGMTLAIERCEGLAAASCRIVLLESADTHLLPGTVIGYVAPSVTPSKWQLWLYSERDKIGLQRPLECVATLSADASTLTFDPPRWKVKVRANVGRLLPGLLGRLYVSPQIDEGERLPVGFNKIYPANGNGNAFTEIRYL